MKESCLINFLHKKTQVVNGNIPEDGNFLFFQDESDRLVQF